MVDHACPGCIGAHMSWDGSAGAGLDATAPVGTSWLLSSVHHGGATVAVPTPSRSGTGGVGPPGIHFMPAGRIGMSDGINSQGGSYAVTATGFTMSDIVTTLAWYGGHDDMVLLVIRATRAVYSNPETSVHIAGNQLTISVPDYTLIYVRTAPHHS